MDESQNVLFVPNEKQLAYAEIILNPDERRNQKEIAADIEISARQIQNWY